MSSSGTPVYNSNYEHNPGVMKVFMSSYPNNPGVRSVWMSDYPDNPGVQLIYRSNYEHNPGVQLIYMTGCFPKSELVHTYSDAYTPIALLKIGDKISSWDVDKKKMQYTSVTGIHKYTVNDIMCINGTMRVSASHPIMVMENIEKNILIPKWKVAFDVNVGNYIVGAGGKLITVKTKSRHWYNDGIEVLNLSTYGGKPFMVGTCIVRAENTQDSIDWADTPVTQKFAA